MNACYEKINCEEIDYDYDDPTYVFCNTYRYINTTHLCRKNGSVLLVKSNSLSNCYMEHLYHRSSYPIVCAINYTKESNKLFKDFIDKTNQYLSSVSLQLYNHVYIPIVRDNTLHVHMDEQTKIKIEFVDGKHIYKNNTDTDDLFDYFNASHNMHITFIVYANMSDGYLQGSLVANKIVCYTYTDTELEQYNTKQRFATLLLIKKYTKTFDNIPKRLLIHLMKTFL